MLIKPLLLVVFLQIVYGENPIAETEVGLIKGLEASDGDYYEFLGIQYATVDGGNPFGPSTPYPPFNGTFEAFREHEKCPQVDSYTKSPQGSIDCLYLNVYVPKSACTNDLLPVMVYIHGGAFVEGSGSKKVLGPQLLIKHDVVIVTFNYRVSAYGFMCLGTPEVPGNQGLKDQLIALRWVQRNIKSFGADPDRVTIMGQSAGARSGDFLLMAEDQKLFNKVIMQSSNALSALLTTPAMGEVNTKQPIILAEYLGFKTDSFTEAVSFLTTVDPKTVVSIANKFRIIFKPCVERDLKGVEKFIPDFTINRKVPNVRKIPILAGYNNNERYFAHVSRNASSYNGLDFFGQFLKCYFAFNETQQEYYEKLMRNFYVGDEEFSATVRQELADFDTDFTYLYSIHRRISQYLANTTQKIYQYVFSYKGERNFYQIYNNISVDGAIHADELGYLFESDLLSARGYPTSKEDQKIIDRMTTMWTNFAKYGDPTPETSEFLPIKWEPISEHWNYCSIGSEIVLKRRPFNRRVSFLDLLFDQNEEYQIGYRKNEY